MRNRYVLAALVTLLIVLDAFLLSSFGAAMPFLLVVAVLLAATHPSRKTGIVLTVWAGLLLDSLSLQPFGVYALIALGMFLITVFLQKAGLDASKLINTGIMVAVLLVWKFTVLALLLVPHGLFDVGASLLLQYLVLQIITTTVAAFAVVRVFNVQ